MDVKEYTATTELEEGSSNTAESLPQRNSYTASSEGRFRATKASVASSLPSLSDIGAYKAVSELGGLVEESYQTGLKISLAEIGVWRQIISYGGVARSPGLRGRDYPGLESLPGDGGQNYSVAPRAINRRDPNNDFVFRCGDYFLPLSFTYNVRADKQTAVSQLVDGPAVYQQINKNPKTVSISIQIQRDQEKAGDSDDASMAFASPDNSSQYALQIRGLGSALNDLYERQDVFYIENKTLNNDLQLQYVYMEDYTFTVNQGSSIVDIEMTLREVNMQENAIVFGSATVNPDKSAGGGSNEG